MTLGALVSAGCLQDYDEFNFGDGGAPPTSATGTTAGPGPTTTGPTTTTTGTPTTATTTTNGPTTTNTVSTTVATTAMSSSSTGVVGPEVSCGSETCDIGAGQVCCVVDADNASCESGPDCPNAGDIPITCDEQDDCNGDICCVYENGPNVDRIECAATCQGTAEDPVCSGPNDPPCADPTNCEPSDDLPAPYMYCNF